MRTAAASRRPSVPVLDRFEPLGPDVPDPQALVDAMETRARTPSHARLRRRFLRFVPIRPGETVLEVGCGSGAVARDLARSVGQRGRVAGIDHNVFVVDAARRLCRRPRSRSRISLLAADGAALPFRSDHFDCTVAVTVLLHVADPRPIVQEMVRVTRSGGRVALQDQDFGTVAVAHPDRELTGRILQEVPRHVYRDPWSGRRLLGLLASAGLEGLRLRTDVYQDTALEPYTQAFLERRAERAVRFGIVDPAGAQHWLDGFARLLRERAFVLTINFYGVVGLKPPGGAR